MTESLARSQATDRYRDLGHALTQAATVLMVSVGALAILDQKMTFGALIAANMLSLRVISPLNMLVAQWRDSRSFVRPAIGCRRFWDRTRPRPQRPAAG